MTIFSRFMNDESGATAIEYGLMAALIGVFIITAVTNVGEALDVLFNDISTELGTVDAAPA